MNNMNDVPRKRGLFPRYPLKSVLEIPEKIYDLGHGLRVRRLEVLDRLGRQPNSSTSRMMITTAGQSGYGLINGGYNADFLELTERGMQVVSESDERKKFEAIYDALFSNDIFSDFIARFFDKSFSVDSVVLDYLSTTHGLNKSDAEACWNVIRQNIKDYGLTQTLSGREVVISREIAMKKLGFQNDDKKPVDVSPTDSPTIKEIPSEDVVPEPKQTVHLPKGMQGTVTPEFHFNIQIHLPPDATPEKYDAIFKSIGKYLLGNQEDD